MCLIIGPPAAGPVPTPMLGHSISENCTGKPRRVTCTGIAGQCGRKTQPTLQQVKLWSVSLKADTVVSQPGVTKAKIAKVHTASTTLHPFNGVFSRTTWVRRYQKGKTSLDLNEARDVGVWDGSGISWTIRKKSAPRSRQITTPTPHQSVFTGRMLFLTPNQQCQSTEGIHCNTQ